MGTFIILDFEFLVFLHESQNLTGTCLPTEVVERLYYFAGKCVLPFVFRAIDEIAAALNGVAMVDEKIMVIGNSLNAKRPPSGGGWIANYLGSENAEMTQYEVTIIKQAAVV
jgi:hypothetical protein